MTRNSWRSRIVRPTGAIEPGPAAVRVPRATGGVQGSVPPALRGATEWSWRFLVVAAAVVVVGYVIVTFKTVVVAFTIALLLAVVMEPVAAFQRNRLGINRSIASLLTIVLSLALVIGALVLAGRSVLTEFGGLVEQITRGFQQLLEWLSDGPLGIGQAQIDEAVDEVTSRLQSNAGTIAGGVLAATGTITQFLTGALIAVFCLFFFLREGRRIWRWFVRLAPRPVRVRINEAGIRAWVTLGSFVRVQALVALVDAIGIALGAVVLGVPFVLPIAVLVFLGGFVPIIGAFVSGAVAVVVALVDQGFVTALLMLGVVLLVQQLEGNVLQPWLQGHALSLHPIAIVLAVTAGYLVAGVLGALLAVPITAVLNTVILYLNGHDKFPRLATDVNRPGGPPGVVEAAIDQSLARIGEEELPEEDPVHARTDVRQAELEVEQANQRLAAARAALTAAEQGEDDSAPPGARGADPAGDPGAAGRSRG